MKLEHSNLLSQLLDSEDEFISSQLEPIYVQTIVCTYMGSITQCATVR